jgi:hypothetical protein
MLTFQEDVLYSFSVLPNLRSVYMSEQPLLVACRGCGHRAALSHGQIRAHKGNMDELGSLKLKCSECGAKDFERFTVQSSQTVAHFLSGADLEVFRKWQR